MGRSDLPASFRAQFQALNHLQAFKVACIPSHLAAFENLRIDLRVGSRIRDGRIDRANGFNLGGGQAIGAVAFLALDLFRIPWTRFGIFNESIFYSVGQGIASVEYCLMND